MTVRLGDYSGEVSTVQRHLIRDNGEALKKFGVDGYFGEETQTAVEQFQSKHNDLVVDGVAGPATQARLIHVNQWSGGEQGQGVKDLQLALLGFTIEVEPDGIYGPLTAEAIRTFQRHNSIQVDGAAGPVTFDTLDKALNVTQVSQGSQGTIFASVVRAVQNAVVSSGTDISIDGVYGSATENGVRELQRLNHLTVDGIAGEITLSLVYAQSFIDTLSGEREQEFLDYHEFLSKFLDFLEFDNEGVPSFDTEKALEAGYSEEDIEEYEELVRLMIEYQEGLNPGTLMIQNTRSCTGEVGYDPSAGRLYIDSCDVTDLLSWLDTGQEVAITSGILGIIASYVKRHPGGAATTWAAERLFALGRRQISHSARHGCGIYFHTFERNLGIGALSETVVVPYWTSSQC